MGKYSEREQLRYHLEVDIKHAMRDYSLISDGDHLLVGLSGGKDSLALVQILGDMSQVFRPDFRVSALHVQMKGIPYQADTEFLQKHCEAHHVEFHVKEVSMASEEVHRKEKSTCFLCSWNRRKALFETAQALGCNKIALGHHRDDFLETLLLNMFFQGSIQSIAPNLQMDKFPIQVIRPLCLISERDLEAFAAAEGYPAQQRNCPFEHDTHRSEVRALIEELESKHPGLKDSLWASMKHVYPKYLP